MLMKGYIMVTVSCVLIMAACKRAKHNDSAAQFFASGKWIDLTYSFSEQTLYWPNNHTGFKLDTQVNGITPAGFYYASNAFSAPEHGGTHLDLLALLDEGDVPKGQAGWGIDILLGFATASAAEHSAPDPRTKKTVAPGEEWAALANVIRNVSAESYPQLAAHGTDLLAGPGSARLTWGFRVLINGVLSTPLPEGEAK